MASGHGGDGVTGGREPTGRPLPLAILITVHHWHSPDRASFHHIAAALRAAGWRVLFLTVSVSPLSWLRRDARIRTMRLREIDHVAWHDDALATYVWFTPWHIANLRRRWANRVMHPAYAMYPSFPMPGTRRLLRDARLILVESGPGLLLVGRMRKRSPRARIVYVQSDDPAAVGFHPLISERESAAADEADLVSVPDASRLPLFDTKTPLIIQGHAVDKAAFDAALQSPYGSGAARRAIFVGMEGLDVDFLDTASRFRPDWEFHIVGPFRDRIGRANVIFHGVLPFSETIPFIKCADIGMNCTLVPKPQFRRETLKTMQYTYCRLPIVAERGVAARWPHVFAYARGDDRSIESALRAAEGFSRELVPSARVRDWSENVVEIGRAFGWASGSGASNAERAPS
jgi:2-beta-glucuronyltransferase